MGSVLMGSVHHGHCCVCAVCVRLLCMYAHVLCVYALSCVCCMHVPECVYTLLHTYMCSNIYIIYVTGTFCQYKFDKYYLNLCWTQRRKRLLIEVTGQLWRLGAV